MVKARRDAAGNYGSIKEGATSGDKGDVRSLMDHSGD